jgi:NTE family protein
MPTADLVMEGGGVKGTALIGALAVLEDRGYKYINVAGTSAGAIIASLVAAGYTAYELRDIMSTLDYRQFLDPTNSWLPPHTRMLVNLLRHWGIYRGEVFYRWISDLLAAKGVRTFGDLRRGIPDRRQVYKLRVVASDVTRGRMPVTPVTSSTVACCRTSQSSCSTVRGWMTGPPLGSV